MLHVPRILVLHEVLFPFLYYLQHQAGNIRFGAKLRHGREHGFEVKDDAARKRHAAEGLPVDAEVDAREIQVGGLEIAVFLVGVAWGHVEGLVDFEAPGAALDGFAGGHFGEESRNIVNLR